MDIESSSSQTGEFTEAAPNVSARSAMKQLAPLGQATILFIAANPTDTERTRFDRELRDILTALRGAEQSGRWQVEPVLAARVSDLHPVMRKTQPAIVHFAGHATEDGILLEDERTGQIQTVPFDALVEFFAQYVGSVECIVLNACYTDAFAKALAQYAPYVIGLRTNASDEGSIKFAAAFYDAVGASAEDDPYRSAFEEACNVLGLNSLYNAVQPVIAASNAPIGVHPKAWVHTAATQRTAAAGRSNAARPMADVLFDVGHGQRGWGVNFGDPTRPLIDLHYADFAARLEGKHSTVGEHEGRLTAEGLQGCRLLVIVAPFYALFDADEISILQSFVGAGGGVLALAHYGGDEHVASNLSKLLRPFGITPNTDLVRDAVLPMPGGEGVAASAAQGSSFLAAGERIFLPGCSTLTVSAPAWAILTTVTDAQRLALAYIPGTMQVDQRLPQEIGAQTVGAAARFGRKGGRIAVLGSWKCLTNAALADARYANSVFVDRLVLWLMEGENGKA